MGRTQYHLRDIHAKNLQPEGNKEKLIRCIHIAEYPTFASINYRNANVLKDKNKVRVCVYVFVCRGKLLEQRRTKRYDKQMQCLISDWTENWKNE